MKATSHLSYKRALVALAVIALAIGPAGCSGSEDLAGATVSGSATSSSVTAGLSTGTTAAPGDGQMAADAAAQTVPYSDTDLDASWDASSASHITLAGGSARFDGAGATVQGSVATITSAGTYVVSGTLDDGQIVVDVGKDDTVKLVLNGATVACSTSAPIYVKNADKVVITLAEGSENNVTGGETYVLEDSASDEPDAAVFSKSDLTINGTGSLTVSAQYNDGIVSKDDLKIVSGVITVDAVSDALKGKDCLGVKNGTLTLTAGADGMQSTNDVDAELGYICIEGGTLDITAENDGIQAQTTLLVSAGEIALTTGGGSANGSAHTGDDWGGRDQGFPAQTATTDTADTASDSAKGLKATGGVYIQGGTITVDSSDDSIHSNSIVRIDGGDITVSTGDDAVHADAALEINGGDIYITKSYEGLESMVITINDGTIHIQSSDDAVNVAGGTDSSSAAGAPGGGAFGINEDNKLYLNGGYVAIDAGGDGLDCNGRVSMTGGTYLVNGPTNDGNGAIDMGEFTVTGGLLVAAGSSGMAQAPSETSSQHSLMVNFDTALDAGTLVHIQDGEGNDVLTFAPTKQFQSLVFCSPVLREGAAYTVYVGGSSSGAVADSLYSEGSYTPGTEYAALTLSGIVTTHGTTGGMGGSGGGMPGGTRPGR